MGRAFRTCPSAPAAAGPNAGAACTKARGWTQTKEEKKTQNKFLFAWRWKQILENPMKKRKIETIKYRFVAILRLRYGC